MLKKTLLAMCVMANTQIALAADSNSVSDYQLAKLAKPISQHVLLNLDPSKDNFNGTTHIELNVLKPTNYIEINGEDYTLNKALLSGKDNCALNEKKRQFGKVTLLCDRQLPVGKYTLTMQFDAPYNRSSVGLYKTIEKDIPYLFTQFEMSDARRAFPSFDEPSYKIPFQLTITAPNGQKVYANTPLIKTESKETFTTHHFAQTPPIASYLVALAVGPFEEKDIPNMSVPGKVITTQGKQHLTDSAVHNMPRVLAALEDYFGIPYVFKKLDSVGLPEFPFGAMENAGLVTYRDDILLLDPNTATQNQKKYHVSVIAHELAHQWYGNLVTMKWWDDLWLNEAFASWMASKITHQLNPELESDLDLPQNVVMDIDARLTTKPIRKPTRNEADIMDGLGLAYSKGNAVLSMIENWIGKDAFQKGMRAYMKEFAFKNAEAADLWQALGKASGKDVASVLSSFVTQSSYPLIAVQNNGKILTLSQQRFAHAGVDAPEQLWNVPVSIKYGNGKQTKTAQVLLTQANQTLELEFEPTWIYPDHNALGYYRWTQSSQLLDSLLMHANEALTTRERLALLEAQNALLDAGVIGAPALLNTLSKFVSDEHPRVATKALSLLRMQKKLFANDSNEPAWQTFIAKAIKPAFEQYGLSAKEGESPSVANLRASIASAQGFDVKDESLKTIAFNQAQKYLKGPASVDANLASVYLRLAAYHGDKHLLAQYTKEFEVTQDPLVRSNLLLALGYFGQPTLQQLTLDYTLTDKVTASDMRIALAGQDYTDSRNERFIEWIFKNYDALAAKLPPFAVPMLASSTADNCDNSKLTQANNFFADKLAKQPSLKRALAKAQESVKNCLSLQQREQKAVDAYLSSLK